MYGKVLAKTINNDTSKRVIPYHIISSKSPSEATWGPWGGTDLCFCRPQPDTSVCCEIMDTGLAASVSCGVHVYNPAFVGTLCGTREGGGHAELIWTDGYIARWFACPKTVTHPSTNRARNAVISLIKTNMLPLTKHAAS